MPGVPGGGTPALPFVQHGGPDAQGAPRFDFSTNGNAAGPLPSVARAVALADRSRYPDPGYHALRERLAAYHAVDAERIVIAGSASEFIHRFTRVAASLGVLQAVVPVPGYGDYAAAAELAGIGTVVDQPGTAHASSARDLRWITEPASPTGSTLAGVLATSIEQCRAGGAIVTLDLAYQPLRLDGRALPAEAQRAWQLWSPNKACGLTGVRAAYAIAPRGEEALAQAVRAHAPSWVVGADGVAMLSAFVAPAAQAELALCLQMLRAWRDALAAALREAAWRVDDARSVTPFFVARAPAGVDLTALRGRGIKLRHTDSMGLPGWVRLSAQPPAATMALLEALADSRVRQPAGRMP